ncbi:helix-turn-helix domain-containing protein [Phenylobacterium sp.]|jgi:excisionase family DNA binding protein|uniref:helix-turn-helix domain-containing protein n=1 Tax=Phenylobacterium sp. TaxID=1871053 RepID=UPI002E343BD8|nr:helix-turn-helix domain-containing protein [Phenylobacterium sp.]HEX3363578.1 helix-turn-helix domain-containing protein [Phenylobacterium sp.]
MSEEVYTVEQFAERLKLHPKTVLRFIKDGRLRAVKVGKSYRILRTEMEATMPGFSFEDYRGAAEAYRNRLEKRIARSDARVTSIIDLPDIAPDVAERMARMLPAARAGQAAHADAMTLEVIYDPPRRHLKVLIVGSPGDTAAMLKMVEVLSED